MTFSKSELKKISTNATKKPDSPQIIIDNPFDADIFVNGIELLLSPEFSKKGKLVVEINDIEEFSAKDSEQFKIYAKYPIPLSKVFRAGHDIKIYAWNGSGDTNTLKMSLNTSLSKDPQPFNSQAVPISISDLNNVVSDPVEIFPQANYSNETQTKLIDMEGFKKMLLLISGSNESTPTVLIGTSNIADNNLNTKDNFVTPRPKTVKASVDFGSIVNRLPSAKIGFTQVVNDQAKYYLEVSDDGVIWSQVATTTLSSTTTTKMSGAAQSFRYLRVQVLHVVVGDPSNPTSQIYELFDSNGTGGTANISFEVLLGISNWIELISSSDIGAVASGGSLTKTIGDVINDGNSRFNYSIPSTQTQFRVKMIVTGNLNLGLSIMKVS